MRVPVQSQPVLRVPNHAHGAASAHGVLPAGDCGTGYWCCEGCNGPICVQCDTKPESIFDAGGGGFTASPAVAGGRVIIGDMDGKIYAFGS